jgi:hypothetical protein
MAAAGLLKKIGQGIALSLLIIVCSASTPAVMKRTPAFPHFAVLL